MWRRWHQAWARYHHSRRRQARLEATQQPALIDVLWSRLALALPSARRFGRPVAQDRRVVLQAMLYVMEPSWAWHTLPSRFPPWQTVYAQLARWRKTGIWDHIWLGLDHPQPTDELPL